MKREFRRLFLASLLGSIFLLQAMACDCAGQPKSAPVPIQATGKVIFGPFEFIAPQGYWYFPRTYPEKGLTKGDTFIVTFFQTRDDIPTKRDKSDYPKHTFLNLYVLRGEYKDFQAYYDAVLNARRSRSISDSTFVRKDLPQGTKVLFKDTPNWDCREETVQHDRPLFSVDCIMLNDIGVIQISAHGEEEKEVLDKAKLLRDTMLSLKINKPKRPD